MDCRLRPATERDREFLYRLHCRTMREVIERTWGWDDDWQVKDFDWRIGAYQVFVIDVGEEPIGGLMLDLTPDNLDIVELQILPEHQRQGIGTWVIERVIDDAKRRGLCVTLSVVPANSDARRLYERIGFCATGVDEPFIRMQYSPSGLSSGSA
jgi:GNAT superfamily N-acetyltransferase